LKKIKKNFNEMTISKYFICFLIIIFLNSCMGNTEKSEEKFEPSADKRAREFADKNPVTIFGGNKSKDEFSSSNIMWRATLKSLEFLPLVNADYTGGIIIYDWYAEENKPNEQIKITVQFLSNELRSDSIKIIAHKKLCDNANRCSNLTLDKKFSDAVKENIILIARSLKIEETKRQNK